MKHARATITFDFEYDEEQFEDGSVYVADVFFENPAEFDWRLAVDEEDDSVSA